MQLRLKGTFGLLLFIAICASAEGQAPKTQISESFPHFTQKQGGLDSDGLPTSGAVLCVVGTPAPCFEMPPKEEDKKLTFQFGLEPHSERLPLADGGSWVFFTAKFSGGGSGTLTRFAVLRYSSEGKLVNLLPWVGVTNVSQYAMWNLPEVSSYPVLVIADFIWGKGETHFGNHFYNVSAWKFDPKIDQYSKSIEFRTSSKYGGGDAAPIRVLGPERQEIIRRLESK